MSRKTLVFLGYTTTALAVLVGVATAIGAESANTIARASTVSGLLGLLGVGTFMFALVAKD